jgi:hypothetical protein
MKESKGMMKKEVSFMKKKGAPKSMIKHEEAEMEGKKMRKFAAGGMSYMDRVAQLRGESDKKRLETRAQRDVAKAPSEKVLATRASLDAKIAASRQASDAKRAARMAPPVPPPAAAPAPLAPPPKRSMPALGGMGAAGGTQAMMRKGGMAGSYRKAADGKAHKGKTEGKMVKMAMGGMAPGKKPMGLQARQFGTGPGMRPMPKHLGKAVTDRGKAILGKASGGSIGSFRRAADGIASKGKTKGTMVKMAYGGKC